MSMSFADLGLPREITTPLEKVGIKNPFPIQAATIPDALAGRDVCGRAPTGSGKTLAFGLPILATITKAAPHRPHALILSPTRELAEQIRRELAPIAAGRGLRLLTVYGGVSYHPQRSKLRSGVDILIACPGRLIDLMEGGDVRLDAVTHVVIDEADRMADMGFMPQVRTLLDQTPEDRQTVLFSATLDGDVAKLTARYQNNPVRHEVGTDALDSGTARHHFWKVEKATRLDNVADVVTSFGSTLVFTRTRRGADRLAQQLGGHGIQAAAIHGGRTQRQRDRALREFTNGKVEVMVATDVAARGIHVDGVDCVVHFDPPEDHKAYLHRSGRTARAGAGGHVVSMVLHDQMRDSRRLQSELGINDIVSDPNMDAFHDKGGQALGQLSERPRSGGGGGGRGGRGGSGRRSSGGGQHRSQSGGRGGQSRGSSQRNGSSRRNSRSDTNGNGTRGTEGGREGTSRHNGSAASGRGDDATRSDRSRTGGGNGEARRSGGGSGQQRRSGGGSGQQRRSGGGSGQRRSNGNGNGNVRSERNVDGNVRRAPNDVDGNVRSAPRDVDGNTRSNGSSRAGGNNRANSGGNRGNGNGGRSGGNRYGGGGGQSRRNSGGSQRSSRSR